MGMVSHKVIRRKIGEARISRPPLRDPEFVCDLFSRLLEERCRYSLSAPVIVTVSNAPMMRMSEALESDVPPALFGVVETRSGKPGGALLLAAPVVHRVIEAMTGAPGSAAAPERLPTSIDEALITGFTEDVIDCFERAVTHGPRPPGGVAISFARFARKATAVSDAPETTDTLVFLISLKIGDDEEPMTIPLVVPLAVLDTYRAAEKRAARSRPLIGEPSAPEAIWTSTMLSAARLAEYRLVGVLHEMTLTVSEISELQAGSILPLPEGCRMEVSLRIDTPKGVAGEPEVASGALGVAAGRRAVRISEAPDEALIENLMPYALGDTG